MNTNTSTHASKNQRLNVRVTNRQEQLIRRAAEATDRSMTDFILQSVSIEAERILAGRRWFVASEEQWEEFNQLLELPLPSKSKLTRLTQRESPFAN